MPLVGVNQTGIQAYNERTLVKAIHLHGPTSRTDIAARTGLTLTAVSKIVANLVNRELVVPLSRRRQGRGKPPVVYAINPEGAYSVGLNLDRDCLSGVLINFVGEIKQRRRFPLTPLQPDEAISSLAETAESLIAAQGISRNKIWGVGVGIPGPLQIESGRVIAPPDFPGWEDVAIMEMLGARLNLPIMMENNATAAAIGELWYGVGQAIANFFYVHIGDGLGGGVVMAGRPYRGANGNAGEFGFIPMVPHYQYQSRDDILFPGAFVWKGLLEHLAAAGVAVDSADDLAALYEQESPPILAWIDDFARRIAPLIATLENILDPDAVIFGGRLPEPIVQHLLKTIERLRPIFRYASNPSPAQLLCAEAGDDAAPLGLATLPIFSQMGQTLGER